MQVRALNPLEYGTAAPASPPKASSHQASIAEMPEATPEVEKIEQQQQPEDAMLHYMHGLRGSSSQDIVGNLTPSVTDMQTVFARSLESPNSISVYLVWESTNIVVSNYGVIFINVYYCFSLHSNVYLFMLSVATACYSCLLLVC